jgi:hypothetical protein
MRAGVEDPDRRCFAGQFHGQAVEIQPVQEVVPEDIGICQLRPQKMAIEVGQVNEKSCCSHSLTLSIDRA